MLDSKLNGRHRTGSWLAFWACLIALAPGCGGGDKGKSGSSVTAGAKASQSALKAKKPAGAQKATSSPRPMPADKMAGGKTVDAPDPFSQDAEGDEVFAIDVDDDIDLDGDGEAEAGDVLYDEESDTLLVWWDDTDDLVGDGSEVAYSAVVWISDAEVGFIIEVADGSVLACVDGDESLCVVCDAEGTCEEAGLDGSLATEDETETETEG